MEDPCAGDLKMLVSNAAMVGEVKPKKGRTEGWFWMEGLRLGNGSFKSKTLAIFGDRQTRSCNEHPITMATLPKLGACKRADVDTGGCQTQRRRNCARRHCTWQFLYALQHTRTNKKKSCKFD